MSALLQKLEALGIDSAELMALLRQSDPTLPAEGKRSPQWKPQTDLRPRPFDRHNPAPQFHFSSEGAWEARPDYVSKRTAYPRLLFKLNGTVVEETAVHSQGEEALALQHGWLSAPPVVDPPAIPASLEEELASLTEDERAQVLEAQRASRLGKIQAKLANLSDADLAKLTGGAEPAKRGPGRPRKDAGDRS